MAGGVRGEAWGDNEGQPGRVEEVRNVGFRPEQGLGVFGVPAADERVRHGEAHPHIGLGRRH
jgi:hypothetical protein